MRIIAILLLTAGLCACGDQGEPPAAATSGSKPAAGQDDSLDDAAAKYQAKVQKKTRDSVVNSLAREWDVPQDKVRCVLGQLKLSQIQQVADDPAAQAVFDDCGVDPAVVD